MRKAGIPNSVIRKARSACDVFAETSDGRDSRPDTNVTAITVRQDAGEATGGGRSFQIISDQMVTLTGTDSLAYDLQDADSFPTGEFDNWAMKRAPKTTL